MEDKDYPGIKVDLSALEDRIMAMEGARLAYQDAVRYGTGVMVIDHNEITPSITHVSYDDFHDLVGPLNELRDMKTVIVVGDPGNLPLIKHEVGTIDHFRIIIDPYQPRRSARMDLPRLMVEPEAYYEPHEVYHEPAPKKIPIKQAPKQPFRLSMRSVNRNR